MTPSPEGRPQETDMELINRWRAGDGRAATRLVGRHSQALARFAASAGEREGIEELVQDTFVRAFASLDSFRGASTLRTWLFTCLLYTSPSPRDGLLSRMPSSA